MELSRDNKTVLRFRVICNESAYLEQILVWYNNTYGTDFSIVKVIYDEVNFAEVTVTKYKPSDIFGIGYQLGVKEQTLREKGEIDW